MADSTLWLRRCICCWNPEQPQPSPSLPHPVLLCACTACTAPCLLQGDHLAVADRRAAPPQAHAPGRWVGAPACSLPACLFSAAAAAGPTSGGVLHPLPACHACSSIGHCRYSFCLTLWSRACGPPCPSCCAACHVRGSSLSGLRAGVLQPCPGWLRDLPVCLPARLCTLPECYPQLSMLIAAAACPRFACPALPQCSLLLNEAAIAALLTPLLSACLPCPALLASAASLKKHTGRELPIDACPIRFGSWMGGDRDGNPNVTAKVRPGLLHWLPVLCPSRFPRHFLCRQQHLPSLPWKTKALHLSTRACRRRMTWRACPAGWPLTCTSRRWMPCALSCL